MRTHELKTWPQYFGRLVDGTKTFEVRKDDRNFQIGDVLILREWWEDYTGRTETRRVSYIMRGDEREFGVEAGYCVMGFEKEAS